MWEDQFRYASCDTLSEATPSSHGRERFAKAEDFLLARFRYLVQMNLAISLGHEYASNEFCKSKKKLAFISCFGIHRTETGHSSVGQLVRLPRRTAIPIQPGQCLPNGVPWNQNKDLAIDCKYEIKSRIIGGCDNRGIVLDRSRLKIRKKSVCIHVDVSIGKSAA